jgi:hypothetical protein
MSVEITVAVEPYESLGDIQLKVGLNLYSLCSITRDDFPESTNRTVIISLEGRLVKGCNFESQICKTAGYGSK